MTMMRSSTQRIATLAARAARARSMSTTVAAMPEQRLFNSMPRQIPKFPAMPKQEPAFKPMPMQARPMPPQEAVVQTAEVPKEVSSGGIGAAPIIAVAVLSGGVAYAYTQGMITM